MQLRKAGITQVVLAGMSANLCVESHRRLIEQGFQVALVVVPDATAAAKFAGYDGFEAAFVNYRMIASDVWSTAETMPKLSALTAAPATLSTSASPVHYRYATVKGVRIHYREAGPADAPVVLLMHGFPTSSHMYRDLETGRALPLSRQTFPRSAPATSPRRARSVHVREPHARL